MAKTQAMSPMMTQYCQIKEENRDCIVFYRLGDFYEMFFEDAELASRELDLTLTARDCGQDKRAPMCLSLIHICPGGKGDDGTPALRLSGHAVKSYRAKRLRGAVGRCAGVSASAVACADKTGAGCGALF